MFKEAEEFLKTEGLADDAASILQCAQDKAAVVNQKCDNLEECVESARKVESIHELVVDIQNDADNNLKVSEELYEEVNRFQV